MKPTAQRVVMTMVGALAMALGLAGNATAVELPINNPGFEAPVLGEGAFTAGIPPGWTSMTGNGGVFNPNDTTHIPGGAPEGQNTHYSNGATLAQVLGSTLTVWTEYTLTVQVGDRLDTPFPGYAVQLGVDRSGTFALLAQDASGLTPVDGFLTSTVHYTAIAGHPDLGTPLVVRLLSSSTQVNFDDVHLTAVPAAPTPDIFVQNAGFEAILLAEGGYTGGAVPGWTKEVAATSGTFNPNDVTHIPGGAPEGFNTHYSNGATLSQVLGASLVPGIGYTLMVDVCDRLDTTMLAYQVQLGVDAGGFVLLAEDNNMLAPSSGCLTATVAYTAPAGHPNLGDPLTIRLLTAAGPSGTQVNFDDVRLTSDTAPLPEVLIGDEHFLVARPFTKILPDGASVDMWGFAADGDGDLLTDDGETPTAPGPVLVVPPASTTLTIHLRNDLTVPTSIVIAGQTAPLNPTWVDASGAVVSIGSRSAGDVTSRIRSFATETAPGAIGTYVWNGLQAGTYLYESGTHQAVQVQMGLYGAMAHDAAAGEAYPGIAYDNQAILLYSEIDPALHAAVSGGIYGTPAYPSTIDYRPTYFLINGAPFPNAVPMVDHGIDSNETLLVRFLNAGLQSRAPTLDAPNMRLVSEDGKAYPYAREQYSTLLAAGKTVDALVVPGAPGTYPVYDRRLALTSGASDAGGDLVYLVVQNPAGAPLAVGDAYDVAEDGSLAVAAPGVLGNDDDPDLDPLSAILVSDAVAGALALAADGSFTYTPSPDFTGSDVFTYKASDGLLDSNTAIVTITVTPVNDAPLAVTDAYMVDEGHTLDVPAPGVLGNDSDVDGDALMATLISTTGHGALTLNADGSFTYSPTLGYDGPDSFVYEVSDGVVAGNQATVDITVVPAPNSPPVAVDDAGAVKRNLPIVINVVANDYDPDGTIVPASVTIVTSPRRGTAYTNGNGTITYIPRRNFRGTDTFTYTVMDNEGAVSNEATVRINVTR